MKRRTFVVLTLLLMVCPIFGQSVKLPAEVKGDPGAFVKVPADTDGKEVRWYSPDRGLQVFPVELLKDSKTAVVIANAKGRYRLIAWTAKGDVPSDPAICTVIIGDAPDPGPNPPVPPDPGPTPTPTTDKWLIFVWESSENLSAGQSNVTRSTKIRDWIRANLKKSGGLPDGEFIMWDRDTDASGYPKEWQDRWAKYRDKAKTLGKPMMFYANGKSIYEGEIPDAVEKCLDILTRTTEPKPVAPEGKDKH